ncbi:putative methyltransferase DDB_G0268948 [Glandiceps talaboti]
MATTKSYTELFASTAIAEAYQKYRGTYPKEVTDKIIEFLQYKNPGPWRLAIDVGCGTGQSTRSLFNHFDTVIGCDVSKAQIEEANKTDHPRNVKYHVRIKDCIPAEDNTADLVTAAQAVHFFDLKKFYKEVDRVLKPNGCLAVYGRGNVQFPRHAKGPELQAVHDEFRYGLLRDFWTDGHKHVETKYTNIELPYEERERYDTIDQIDTTVEGFVGYLSSLSAFHKFQAKYPERTDVLEKVTQKTPSPEQKYNSEVARRRYSGVIPYLIGGSPLDSLGKSALCVAASQLDTRTHLYICAEFAL